MEDMRRINESIKKQIEENKKAQLLAAPKGKARPGSAQTQKLQGRGGAQQKPLKNLDDAPNDNRRVQNQSQIENVEKK